MFNNASDPWLNITLKIIKSMSDRIGHLLGDSLWEFTMKLVFSVFAMLVPLYGIIGAMVFFIMADFFTGVFSAYRQGQPITARKMSRTLWKFLFYNLVVIVGFVFETFIWNQIPMIKIVSVFVSLTELKSIFENFDRAFKINLWQVVKGHVKNLIS